jgi:hypothetical protein
MSVVHAASILLSHNLQEVTLYINMSKASVGPLMHLGKLASSAGLKRLDLHLMVEQLGSQLQSDLGPFLSVLSGIGEVEVSVVCRHDAVVWWQELRNAKAKGLPCPRVKFHYHNAE